jgi:hypothetical protein
MKKFLFTTVIMLFTITASAQVNDSTAKYQCLTISNIMDSKISDVWLDDGFKNRSIGVRNEDGTLFKTNTQVLNYVCKKYNLELVTVTEEKDVYKFYLVKKRK